MSQGASGQAGRYNRSFEGLIGAIIVIVLVVVGFVLYRNLFSDPPEQKIEEVDYLDSVLSLQQGGFDVPYPADLPDGWKATEVLGPEGDRVYGLNFFTDDDRYVGLRVVDEDVDDLLDRSGIEDADEADPLTDVDDVARTWDGWVDPNDDDHAFTAEVDGLTVLVYGSTSADDLADLVARLTLDPIPVGSASASPTTPAGS